MNKQVFESQLFSEKYTLATFDNGLSVYVMEKSDYTSSYALFGTKYGSVDVKFRRNDGEFTSVPAGIAHFLEHKLFESEDGDAFSRFSMTGAYANAYTSFDRTAYLFSCSERFEENFDILLDFVQSPYFTKQTVEKEQGIIGQEIRMYEDSAQWRVFFNLLGALYKNHPIKIDIAGTAESIAKITPEVLYECYHTFYNPSNMFITVVGNQNTDKVLEQISKSIKETESVKIERDFPNEPKETVTNYIEQKFEVAQPLFCFGYKESCNGKDIPFKQRIHTEILFEIIAGKSSRLYKELVDNDLVNPEFSFEYFTGKGHAAVIFDGESSDPKAAAEQIKKEISRIKQEGIDEELFLAVKKRHYGNMIMAFNSIEGIATALTECAVRSENLFEIEEIFASMTIEDINRRIEAYNEDYSALSVVKS